jgi:hypothetical protein
MLADSQFFEAPARVVDDVGAAGADRDFAARGSCVDRNHGQRVAVHVGVVGEHVDRLCRALVGGRGVTHRAGSAIAFSVASAPFFVAATAFFFPMRLRSAVLAAAFAIFAVAAPAAVPAGAAVEEVVVGSAVEKIGATAGVETVVAGTAGDLVGAFAGRDQVVAGTAADDVVPAAADDPVVAAEAHDRIVVGGPAQMIVTWGTDDRRRHAKAGQVGGRGAGALAGAGNRESGGDEKGHDRECDRQWHEAPALGVPPSGHGLAR